MPSTTQDRGSSAIETGRPVEEMRALGGSAYDLAAVYGVKDVIDPRETRAYVIEMLKVHRSRLTNGIGEHLLGNWPTSYV